MVFNENSHLIDKMKDRLYYITLKTPHGETPREDKVINYKAAEKIDTKKS